MAVDFKYNLSEREHNIVHDSGISLIIHDKESKINVASLLLVWPLNKDPEHNIGAYQINVPIPQNLEHNVYHKRRIHLYGNISTSKTNYIPEFKHMLEDNPWLSTFNAMYNYVLKQHNKHIYSLKLINQLSFISNLNCLPTLNINPICQVIPNAK
jgi:hypothetical protein